MKQKLLSMMLLLFALIAGTSMSWADETTTFDLSKKTYTTGTNSVTWTSDYITINNSGTNATNYLGGDANNRTSSRFYSGNTLTITPASGYSISTIEFTATSTNYANTLGNSTWSNATSSVSSTTVTVTATNGANPVSATVGGTCGFTSITVTYAAIGGTPTCATPTFSPAAGVYSSPQDVTISSTDGATIYYTTDGSDPTTGSSVYSSAIPVSSDMTIKALATKSDYNNSSVATATYTIVEHAGTEADPYSVADARKVIDAQSTASNVYVTGIVYEGGSNLSSGALNYWISDDGTETDKFEIYRGKGIDGANFTSTNDIVAGDIVVVKGNIKKYNTTYEFDSGSTLISRVGKTNIASISGITPTSLLPEDNGTFSVTAEYAEGKSASDATITWATSDDEVIDVDPSTGEYLAYTEGTADITVTITPNDAVYYNAVSETYTVTVAKNKVNMTAFTASATTLNVGGTATTEVSNDQPGWTAAYTYESSDPTKVTVDVDGNIEAVAEGSATITASLNVSGSDNAYKAGDVTSMTVTITVTAAAIHTITYSINGNTDRTDSAAEGAEIDLPTDVDNIGGLTFVGWSETEASPVVISSNPTMGNSDKTFYAVWGKMSQSVDVLNNAFIGVEGTTYSSWSNKKGTSGAVYQGNSAGGNSSIQLRSNNNNSGVVTTVSGGKATKISVKWNSNTTDTRVLSVYGSNDAYSNAENLYSEDYKGDLLGEFTKSAGDKSLTITGDYKYIGIRSKSGALYLDEVVITWSGDASGLYTTIDPVSVTITDAQYATFCDALDRDFTGTGITVYMAKSDGTKVDLTEVTDGIVPAGKGVVLYSATEVTKAVPAATATAASYNDAENELVGITERTQVDATDGAGKTNYILSNEDAGVGFYAATDGNYLAANKAYLSTANPASVRGFLGFAEGDADAISEIVNGKSVNGTYYDLSGRRVSKAQKGIYIVNGKKVVK